MFEYFSNGEEEEEKKKKRNFKAIYAYKIIHCYIRCVQRIWIISRNKVNLWERTAAHRYDFFVSA